MLETRDSVQVAELAETFSVSEVTVRSDLTTMAERGLVSRVRGGVRTLQQSGAEVGFDLRLRLEVERKRAIARAAAAMVDEGEAVALDASTTAYYLALELRAKRELVVVTNGLLVATALADAPGITVLVTGGMLRLSAMSLVGDLGADVLRTTRINKGFLGARGVSLERGLMDLNPDEVTIKQEMADACEQVYGIFDGTKWHRSALLAFVPVEKLAGIVTDSSAPASEVDAWRGAGVDVITVDPRPARGAARSSARPSPRHPEGRSGRVTSFAGPLSGIPAPADLWDASAATGLEGLSALVHRSNLLGADRSVANQGGGNTSAKGVVVDHAGREQRVLWVKGSGTDLATITSDGFAALLLDEVEPLRSREAMDDASMVDYLRRCALEPDQPRPSIETLLHAFVDAAHVDHTHPDAVIALTSTPNGRSLADEAFGDEAVWLDYQRPGFDMSKRIAELLDAHPSARAVLLERHGLVTWGSTSEEAYRSTIEFVTRAAEAVDKAGAGRFGLGGRASAELGGERVPRPPGADASRAPRLAPRRCGRRGARGRPEPRGGRIRLVGTGLRGEPGRRTVPRPPDQHEAQAARRRLRPGESTAPPTSAPPCDAVSTSTARGTASTTRGTSTTRPGSSPWIRSARGSS